MTILSRMTALAACICEQIRTDGSPEPCWCGVMPGQEALLEALGNACDGGLAWVRLASVYPSEIIGQPSQKTGNCGTGTGFDLEMGIARLVTVEEEAPDEAEALAAVDQQVIDMQTMRRALACCGAIKRTDYILGQYTPLGPLGGVVGGTWTIFCGL